MTDDDHLDRARTHLRRASDAADRTVQNQVDSLDEGLFEEQDGSRTQAEPGPKADRVAEIADKLDGLADEAADEAADHVLAARDHCREFLAQSGADE